MRRLTFTKYNNLNNLFSPIINGSIAVINFKAVFQDPNIITLAEEAMILLRNCEKTDKEATKFTIQPGNYTISQLNEAISTQIPRIKITNENEIKASIITVEEGYTAIISPNLLASLGFKFKDKDKELTGKYIASPPSMSKLPKKVFLYCGEIDGQFNEIDGQPSQELCSVDIENNIGTCSPINPIFIPLFNDEPVDYLHLKLIDENGIEVIPKTFHLVVYIK